MNTKEAIKLLEDRVKRLRRDLEASERLLAMLKPVIDMGFVNIKQDNDSENK